MMNDSAEILNSLLCDWHRWAKGYQHVGGINTSPMFREVKSGRQWDTVDEIISSDLVHSQMEALDSIIMQLRDVYRTSLQLQARNLHTGYAVWTSARLPADPLERATILGEARAELTVKLQNAGVL
jgi:hypothetical protein